MTEIYEDDFDEDEAYFDCALMPDGQCMKAGSEECDFECPLSHGSLYAGSEAWHRAHSHGRAVEGCQCPECQRRRHGN